MGTAAMRMAGYQQGGKVSGPGTGTSDSVPVRLSKGEFVVPADSVKKIGVQALKALVAATHKHVKPVGKAPVRKMANGGVVGDDEQKPGGAVFGFFPQLAGSKQTSYATDNAIRTGVTANGAPAAPVVTSAQQGLPAGVSPSTAGAGRGDVNPDLANPASAAAQLAAPVNRQAIQGTGTESPPAPMVNGGTGTAVIGAPGVSKFVQSGNTLYSNMDVADNSRLMSRNPGVQIIPGGGQGAAATMAAPASDALSAARAAAADRGDFQAISDSYGGNFAGGQYPVSQPQAARIMSGGAFGFRDMANDSTGNYTRPGGSDGAIAGLSAQQQATVQTARDQNATQRAVAQMTAAAGIQGHLISADASKYGANVGAGTAAARLATEAPEIAARTGELGAHARERASIAAAQQAVLNSKTSGEQETAQDKLRSILGKDRNYPDLYQTTNIPGHLNPATGTYIGGAAVVTDKRSGETRLIRADGGQPQAEDMPASKDKLVSGKVYQTGRGPAKWDGNQFVAQ